MRIYWMQCFFFSEKAIKYLNKCIFTVMTHEWTRYHNQIEAVGIYLFVFIIFGIIWQQKRAISINCCIYCYQVNNKTVEKTSIKRNWFVRLMLSSRFSVLISISTRYKKCKHWKWFNIHILLTVDTVDIELLSTVEHCIPIDEFITKCKDKKI